MECYIYSCPIRENEFLIMSADELILNCPPDVQLAYKNPEIIKTINLDEDSNFTDLNSAEVLENLESNNYYLFTGSYNCVMGWEGAEGMAMEESVEIPINVPE